MSSRARMTMRAFSDAFLDDYLAREGEAVLGSVGGYHFEGLAPSFSTGRRRLFHRPGTAAAAGAGGTSGARVASVMKLTGAGKIAGVIGWPIAHSAVADPAWLLAAAKRMSTAPWCRWRWRGKISPA